MSQVLEVRKAPDGKVFARRKDGLPLTPEDREEARKLAEDVAPLCWNCGGTTTETKDIYDKSVFACWGCAKWA